MAKLLLPANLTALFPGAPREMEVEGATVLEVIEALNARFPGMRSRLLDAGPRLREHILVAVDGVRVGLSASVGAQSVVRIIPSITGG